MTEQLSPSAHLHVHGDVAVLTISSPPVNALSRTVRVALLNAVREVAASRSVDVLVINCAGRTFFAGADIREFGLPPEPPFLPDVVEAIENCPKPIVAAIHGTALGGGLEVAMACHYRVAVPSAKLGLPEVKLGLMPGAGGTQRLPRLVGVERALEMMTSGTPLDAAEAQSLGLVDKLIVDGDLLDGAIKFASARACDGSPPRTREREDKLAVACADPQLFDRFLAAKGAKFRRLAAPVAIVEAVRAGLVTPFAEAVAHERAAFLKLREGPQSKALRHVFAAERTASKVPGIAADTSTMPIGSVGVIGAGTMGAGIAMTFLSAGFPVTLVEASAQALERGVESIARTIDRSVASGRIGRESAHRMLAALEPSLEMPSLGTADLIVEAAYESMEVKQQIFASLDKIAKPQAILATNTSYLDVDAIAGATSRPDHVLGLHFFSPAHVMKLLEIVRGDQTSPTVLASALALARQIGKVAVVAGNAHGFIGNRMLAVRRHEADALVLEGALPWDVDRVMVDFGMPMGPFQISDLAGLDLGWSRATSSGSTIRELLCERDRRGQKTGAGFYDYDEKRMPTPSPLTEQLIAELAVRNGIVRRAIDDSEILERLVYPMINEGAKLLAEGVALRASDIDVVWLNGYGWPAETGGPMYYAENLGLAYIVNRLHRLSQRLGPPFEPAPLLVRLANSGAGFDSK